MDTISIEEAEDIAWGGYLAKQEVSEHRWYTKYLVVFVRDGETLGFHYLEPATEDQEDQDLFEGDPVPVFPVVGHEVTRTTWEQV